MPLSRCKHRALCCALFLLAVCWQQPNQATGQEISTQAGEQQQQQQMIRENSIASVGGQTADANQLILSQQQLKQLDSPTTAPVRRNELAKLERRIDWLEFEFRKSLHQLQQQQQKPSTGDNQATGEAQAQPAGAGSAQANRLPDSKLTDLSERLNLVEKFITITTTKMYEVEQKLAQLNKCECQISCKWAPNQRAPGNQIRRRDANEHRAGGSMESNTQNAEQLATATAHEQDDRLSLDDQRHAAARSPSNSTRAGELKRDGQSWLHECDICSCHRGHVSCQRQSCPAPACEDPQQVRGKCCPVCYKPCTFKGQSVRHGNKLVINSDEQMCKECLCLDGRFKCQRVNLMGARQSGASSLRLQRWADNNLLEAAAEAAAEEEEDDANEDEQEDEARGGESAIGQAQLIEPSALPAELELEDGSDGSVKLQRPKRKRKRDSSSSSSWPGSWPPVLCPPVECPAAEQFRLHNDCCTYCRGHDFCRRPDHFRLPDGASRQHPSQELFHARHHLSATRCHPDAACLLTNLHQTTPTTAPGNAANVSLRSLESMFKCECRRGFTGDGQSSCADVDECRDARLNDCDPKTTSCVNLAGDYECQCRPGFKAAPVRLARNSSSSLGAGGSNDVEPVAVVQAGERRVLQKCVDVNECLEGKLNRCHPQAKCVNLPGSYKCHCKRGFLGNGFQCHKWFTARPNMAAYLYRHTDSAGDAGGGPPKDSHAASELDGQQPPVARAEQSDLEGSSEIGAPARLTSRVNWPLNSLDEEDGDDDEDDDDHDDDDNRTNLALNTRPPRPPRPPRLSDAQWAPLVGEPDAHQALNLANDGSKNSSSSSMFTRTMFWQPAPKLPRPRPWWAQSAPMAAPPKPPMQTNSADVTRGPANQTGQPQNDRQQNDPGPEPSVTAPSSQPTPHSIQQQQQTGPALPRQQVAAASAGSRPALSGYKRGTIIASASTSRRRGASPHEAADGRAYSQHYNAASGAISTAPSLLPDFAAHLKRLTQIVRPISGTQSLTSFVSAVATNLTPPIWMLYTLLICFYSSFLINQIQTIYSP